MTSSVHASSDPIADVPEAVLARARKVRLAAFDVDGTLTDGRLWYDDAGNVSRAFHARDGLGLKRLQAHGIAVAIITARAGDAVARRMRELGIAHVFQGQEDKRACLEGLLRSLGLAPDAACCVGDDLPDLPAMGMAGLAVAVADAHPWVVAKAHWCTPHAGGAGAARDVCDLLLAAQGKAAAERARWT